MRRLSTALTTIALALLAAATLPGAAAAALHPTVTLNESAGSAAGSTGSLGLDISFNPSAGDAVKDVAIHLPPGLLVNEETDGGACLSAPGPLPACQIGSGQAVIAGATTPMTLFLVKPPASTDAAGVELVAGGLSLVGDLAFRSAPGVEPLPYFGSEIDFTGLPASSVASLDFTLTGLRWPTSCRAWSVDVSLNSQVIKAYLWRASAPFTVTGCLTLPYVPTATETTTRDPHTSVGDVVFNMGFAPGDAATQKLALQLASNVTFNTALNACLDTKGCTVGTVTATSPVLPAGQLSGTMVLSGSPSGELLSVELPPPLDLILSTSSFSSFGVTFSSLPDLPLQTLSLNFTGIPSHRLFIIGCYSAPFQATFTPWSGNAGLQVKHPVSLAGCSSAKRRAKEGKPKVSVSLSGLGADTPRMLVRASRGKSAPPIRSLSIRLPSGLSLVRSRLSKHALSVRGGKVGSVRIHGGALVVVFARPVAHGSFSLTGPLLAESAGLMRGVRGRRVHSRRMTIRVTDAPGRRTQLTLSVPVR